MAKSEKLHAIPELDGCTSPILPTQSTPWRQQMQGDGHDWADLSHVRRQLAAR